MTNYFQYKSESVITAKSLHGNRIEVLFDDGEPDRICLDGEERNVTCDSLNGIFVFMTPAAPTSLAGLVCHAAAAYPEIMAEVRRERRAEERHADSCRAGREKI